MIELPNQLKETIVDTNKITQEITDKVTKSVSVEVEKKMEHLVKVAVKEAISKVPVPQKGSLFDLVPDKWKGAVKSKTLWLSGALMSATVFYEEIDQLIHPAFPAWESIGVGLAAVSGFLLRFKTTTSLEDKGKKKNV